MYEYEATIVSVHDGDTLRADVDLGFDTWRGNEPFRLLGIQAPELGKPGGRESRDWLRDLLPIGTVIRIVTEKDRTEKYGRYLATIFLPGKLDDLNVNEALVDAGHAVRWDGTGPRPTGLPQ